MWAEKYNFLGISIVGQSNERGDGGIYIGSIMKGGAVAADGRIEPGDMLLQVRRLSSLLPSLEGSLAVGSGLRTWRVGAEDPALCTCTAGCQRLSPPPPAQVNDINFENMSNDDAVRVLREIVHQPGWVRLLPPPPGA